MKVNYLATLTAVSLLSLGIVVGCANPCAGKTNDGAETTDQVDPCAGKKNPCASKENPCASKENPCASKDKQ
ncbi:MAG: hypothetical protein AAFS12_00350 [Cyanobacteria bacterium J06632_19]